MGGASFSGGESQSQQQSTSEQSVFQAPIFEQLFGQASQLATGQLGQVGQFGQDLSQQLLQQGQGNLGQLNQIAAGTNPLQAQLIQQTQAGNPELQNMIDQLGTDINRNLGQQLQTINSQAGLGGTRGGSRNQIARGLASQAATDAFTQGASNLRFQDFQNRQNLTQDLLGQQFQASQASLANLSPLFNLGLGGFNAAFLPLQNLAQILGGPTTLTESQSSGESESFNFSSGILD